MASVAHIALSSLQTKRQGDSHQHVSCTAASARTVERGQKEHEKLLAAFQTRSSLLTAPLGHSKPLLGNPHLLKQQEIPPTLIARSFAHTCCLPIYPITIVQARGCHTVQEREQERNYID